MTENGFYDEPPVRIRVVGVGGGGCNTINYMLDIWRGETDFVAVDTSTASLMQSRAKTRVRLGDDLVHGHGASGSPDLGRRAAEASEDELYEVLRLSDLVFVVCGLGGGTGTGAAPVIARVAKEVGALVLGVVTRPYTFEGTPRLALADAGIEALRQSADGLIMIEGDRLGQTTMTRLSLPQAFTLADETLSELVLGIVYMVIDRNGFCAFDLNGLRNFVNKGNDICVGMGLVSNGANAYIEAARIALESPLLRKPPGEARSIRLYIATGPVFELNEMKAMFTYINNQIIPEAKDVSCLMEDGRLGHFGMRVILLANDFG